MRNIFLFILFLPFIGFAQNPRGMVRDGNKSFKESKFSDAEIKYRKALQKDPNLFEGKFNLGDALYRQQKFEEASEAFSRLSENAPDKKAMAQSFHNLGNTYINQKKYEQAVDAYKKALRADPTDADTKYNLAYAQMMLKQEQQKKQDQKKDQNKKDQDKKDQDKKDKDKKDQDKKDQDKKDQDQKNQKQQKPDKPKISKEDAQRMLDALNNQEKDLHKKLGKKESVRIQVEKDW